MKPFVATLTVVALLLTGTWALAWGRRGHSSIAELAAYLVAEQKDARFLKEKSYDLGFYANIPDLAWKKPATYDKEHPEHFLDIDLFDSAFQKKEEKPTDDLFIPDRVQFFKTYADLSPEAGRAPWRIHELNQRLTQLTEQLRKSDSKKPEHQDLQGQWLITAGTMAHYVGDLGMPLHCSENYDGEATGQKGIHSFFEDVVVDELFPELAPEVLASARKAWPAFHKANEKKEAFRMAIELCRDSYKQVASLLAIDKKVGRDDLKAARKAYRSLIKERFAKSVLVLAEIYQRQLGWDYNGRRFFFFNGSPDWIAPTSEAK